MSRQRSILKASQALLSLSLLLSLVSDAATTENQSPISIEGVTGLQALFGNALKVGHTYLLHHGTGLSAAQTSTTGVHIQINGAPAGFPNSFLLKTNRKLADGTQLLPPICATYLGLSHYPTVLGSEATVHQFKEVACPKPAPSKQNRPANIAIKPSPTQTTNHRSEKPVEPNHIQIDTSRWQHIAQQDGVNIYLDRLSVRKEILALQRQPGEGPPVRYTFWIKGADASGNVSEPVQGSISCVSRHNVPPESGPEKLYNYFCLSADAQNLNPGYTAPTPEQLQAQQQLRTGEQMMQDAQRRQYLQNAGSVIQQIIPFLR